MSSPESWAGWQRRSVLSLSPHSAEGALIGRQSSKLQKMMLLTKVRNRNVFTGHLHSKLFCSIIICNLCLRTTTVSMSFTQGQGHVWRESFWVFLWKLQESNMPTCCWFAPSLDRNLALYFQVLLTAVQEPEDWINNALYWLNVITARPNWQTKSKLHGRLWLQLSEVYLPNSFYLYVFVYFILKVLKFYLVSLVI